MTNFSPSYPLVVANRFSDFDSFEASARGWDLDFRQLDTGPFSGKVTQILTPSVLLSECRLGRKMDQRGATPPGFRTIAIPVAERFAVRWRGHAPDGNHLLVFPQSNEIDCLSLPGFHVYPISVSERRLEAAAEMRGLESTQALFPGAEIIRCHPRVIRRLRDLARELLATAAASPERLRHAHFQHTLEDELVESVLEAVMGGAPPRDRPMARTRSQTLRRAISVIEDRADEALSVTELTRLSGTSPRTLRYVFEEAFGLSPKQYLLRFRLNRVHRGLRQADPQEIRVADVANDWGFWHMGQFASDYRKLFEELPSETLVK